MTGAQCYWQQQRFSGLWAMCCLILTLLALIDGLRTGIFGSADIRLIPGEEYAISGPMPPKTQVLDDFVIDGQPGDLSVELVPENIFTGYWLGGSMWRGRLLVHAQPQPGTYILQVRDPYGEKQNPALVFTVRVFASALEKQLNSPSYIVRKTGLNTYLVAALLFFLGCLGILGNYLGGRKWHASLARHGCAEIFRLQKTDHALEAQMEMLDAEKIPLGTKYNFVHPLRGDLGSGHVIGHEKNKITLRITQDMDIRLGDIACPQQGGTYERPSPM